jgi:y4mF family transcriptional regulator
MQQASKFPEKEIYMSTLIETPLKLGDTVRHARKALGLTQPQLALAAGVGVRFIVDLEAGKPTVRLEHVLRVLQALGGTLAVIGLNNSQAETQE